MPTKFKSPYATWFTTGVKNGTPCSTVVWNISKKTNKPVNTIWNSLYKAGLCWRTKFNGTWLYWPSFTFNYKKTTKTNRTTTQNTMWQSFIDWCLCSGYGTPTQFKNNSGSQKAFMNYCRSFFGKQFSTSSKSSAKSWKKPTAKKSWKSTTKPTFKTKTSTKSWNKTWSTPTTWTRNYKFPTLKTRTSATSTTRKYKKAA